MPTVLLEEQLKHAAGAFGGVQLLVLFGSTARGSETLHSDVDVGVILETGTSHGDIETALGRAANRPIDVIDLHEAPPQLRFEIARDGTVLLERVPHAWADFRARAMIDWRDWAPTARMIHAAAIDRLRQRTTHGPG